MLNVLGYLVTLREIKARMRIDISSVNFYNKLLHENIPEKIFEKAWQGGNWEKFYSTHFPSDLP